LASRCGHSPSWGYWRGHRLFHGATEAELTRVGKSVSWIVVEGKLWGFHPGLFGLVVNLTIALTGSALQNAQRPTRSAV